MPSGRKNPEATKSKAKEETSNDTGKEFRDIFWDSCAGIKSGIKYLRSLIYAECENLNHRLKKLSKPTKKTSNETGIPGIHQNKLPQDPTKEGMVQPPALSYREEFTHRAVALTKSIYYPSGDIPAQNGVNHPSRVGAKKNKINPTEIKIDRVTARITHAQRFARLTTDNTIGNSSKGGGGGRG